MRHPVRAVLLSAFIQPNSEIRDKGIDLYEPVPRLAAEEVRKADLDRPFIMVAGVCGPTEQAVEETEIARKLGYDAVLLSMGGLSGWSEEDILRRTETIAQRMPVIGFYLQPSVGATSSPSTFGAPSPKFRISLQSRWPLQPLSDD